MNEPVELLAVVVAAIGSLLAGLGAVWAVVQRRSETQTRGRRKGKLPSGTIQRAAVRVGIVVLAFAAGLVAGPAYNRWQFPANVKITSEAWSALNRGDYAEATSIAEECVTRFGTAANQQQDALVIANRPMPPVGHASEIEIRTVLERGQLNDVAACLYIQGQSAERRHRVEEAKMHYAEVRRYTYARIWDRQGILWSPSDVASARLRELQK